MRKNKLILSVLLATAVMTGFAGCTPASSNDATTATEASTVEETTEKETKEETKGETKEETKEETTNAETKEAGKSGDSTGFSKEEMRKLLIQEGAKVESDYVNGDNGSFSITSKDTFEDTVAFYEKSIETLAAKQELKSAVANVWDFQGTYDKDNKDLIISIINVPEQGNIISIVYGD